MRLQVSLLGMQLGLKYLLIVLAFALWGATFGTGSAVVEAIFADSTPTGGQPFSDCTAIRVASMRALIMIAKPLGLMRPCYI